MTIENRWRAHVIVGGHHRRIGTDVPILLLLLRPILEKMTLEISV